MANTDIELTEKGKENKQKKLAEKVANLEIPITKIIHSPLHNPARVIRHKRGSNKGQLTPMTMDERLIEMDFGDDDDESS